MQILDRLLRLLVAAFYVEQVDVNVFKPTKVALTLGNTETALDAAFITGQVTHANASKGAKHFPLTRSLSE